MATKIILYPPATAENFYEILLPINESNSKNESIIFFRKKGEIII